MLDLRVLGSTTVEVDGATVDLGGPRQRAVLALLLVAQGEVVSVDRLIDDLWRGEPPPRAIGALQALRVQSAPPARTRSSAAHPRDSRPTYGRRPRLPIRSGAAREQLTAATLDAGDATAAALTARALTREHPLREEGWRLLALAQYVLGRQADALAALRDARTVLADELGIDPGPALVAHQFGESLSTATARRAADHARAAAAQAESRFAHDAASGYYGRAADALRRLPQPESAAELVDMLARRSHSQLARGDSAAARTSREEAIEVAVRHGAAPLRVRALTAWDLPTPWINRPYGSLDHRLIDLVRKALRYPDLDSARRCRLLLVFVDEALAGVPDSDVLAAGTEALALARTTDDPLLLGWALGFAADLFEVTGSPFERPTIAGELIDLGEAHDLPVLAVMGHFNRLQEANRWPALPTLQRHLTSAEELADRYGYGWRRAHCE